MMWGSLFQSVLSMSLTASVAILVVLAARLLLRRAPKIFSYALWAIVLFRLCCPVAVTSELSLFGWIEKPLSRLAAEMDLPTEVNGDADAVGTQIGANSNADVVGTQTGMNSDAASGTQIGANGKADAVGTQTGMNSDANAAGTQIGANGKTDAAGTQTGINSNVGAVGTQTGANGNADAAGTQAGINSTANAAGDWKTFLTSGKWMVPASYLWAAGVLVMAVYSLITMIQVRRRLVGAVLLRDNIYVCDYIQTPFVMGIFKPRIYLCSALKNHEMEYIILHEQQHIRRRDHVIKIAAFAVLCIHWFNPLVWAAFVLAGKDMEMSCDEAVVAKMGDGIRWDYSKSLLVLATGHQMIAGAPLAFGEGNTRGRIHNLLKKKKAGKWLVGIAAAVLVIASVLLLTDPAGADSDDPAGNVVNGQFGDDDQNEPGGESDDQTAEPTTGTEKEPDEIIVTMDDETRKNAIANSPEWAKEVWEKFNEYEEPVSIWIGDSYAGFMDQVVYDNGDGQKVTKFPAMDYDGDGTLDRIYGNHNTGEDGVYLFSGSGEILLLGKPYWGFSGSTCSADLTGDGVNELIYISWVSGTGGESYCAAAWERIDGQWNKMDITPSIVSGTDSVGNLNTLTLSLQIEKTGENRIRLTQPDVGKSFEHEVTPGYMPDLWQETREDNQPYVTEIWSDLISVVNDQNTGKSYLLVTGAYGNKWYGVPCSWLLGYESGEWKILDFWGDNESEKSLKQQMTEILWQRMVSMVLDLAPSDRDDWLAYWSGESQVDMILGDFDAEDDLVKAEGKDNPSGRSYQVNTTYDMDEAYNTGWYWLEHYQNLSLEERCENADGYLAYSYHYSGNYTYSDSQFDQHREEGLLEVTGTLKRTIYPAGEKFLNQRELEGQYVALWNAVMGAAAERYLEQVGDIPVRMAGTAYLMNFDTENLAATFWVCLEGQSPVKMTAYYTWDSCEWSWDYEGEYSTFDPGYKVVFDETAVIPDCPVGEELPDTWLGLEFDLTTERLAD